MKYFLPIDRKEAEDLLDFFYKDGYISYEMHEPVHDFIRRLQEFAEGRNRTRFKPWRKNAEPKTISDSSNHS